MEGDIHVDCTFGHRGVALGEMRRPFHRGKVYVIAGPNGAGKSTLLQTIAGELEPVTGTVRIGDTDPASRAGAGSVARVADPVFLPDLTVGEHLKLLASHGTFDYEDVVQHWGLEALVASMPAWISSGQRAMKWSHSHEHYHCKNPGCAVPIGCSSVGDCHRTRCGKLAYHAFIDAFPGATHTRRVLCGVRWNLSLPGLLQAGKTRLITTGLWTIFDAANTSAGLAATWLRRNPKGNFAAPTANTWVLFCRRVARRSYLLVLFAIQLLLVVATAHLDSKVALLFVLAWAILGAGFYRAADLSQLGVRSVVPLVVLLIHGCVAAISLHLAWGYTHPLMGAIATIVTVVWISQRRGADRAAVQPAASVDPGLGVAVPTDTLQYHGRGLRFGSVGIGLIWCAL